MTSLLSRISRWLGLGKSPYDIRVGSPGTSELQWTNEDRENMRANLRNMRLAQIARQRDALKTQLAKAKKQKGRRVHIYAALDALKREEMALAGDRP